MNKKMISSLMVLAATSLLASCGGGADKGEAMDQEAVVAAVEALDASKDAAFTKETQISTTKSFLNQGLYVGYYDAFEQQIGSSVYANDKIREGLYDLTKYNNKTFVSRMTDSVKTAEEGAEAETSETVMVIYIDEDGTYINKTYYGEGDENNFGYSMEAEYAQYMGDYETWDDWFNATGYGCIGSVQFSVPDYIATAAKKEAQCEVSGTKYKDGSFEASVVITVNTTVTGVLTFNSDPSYDPAAQVITEYSFKVGADGNVTEEASDQKIYICGSILTGAAYDEPFLAYESGLISKDLKAQDNGDYTGSYYDDVEVW